MTQIGNTDYNTRFYRCIYACCSVWVSPAYSYEQGESSGLAGNGAAKRRRNRASTLQGMCLLCDQREGPAVT